MGWVNYAGGVSLREGMCASTLLPNRARLGMATRIAAAKQELIDAINNVGFGCIAGQLR